MRAYDEPDFWKAFWSKVTKEVAVTSPHVTTPCWPWTGATNNKGYGVVAEPRNGGGQRIKLAHRVSYARRRLLLDSDKVLHKCDRPACVRPSHLRKGTISDNANDSVAKGRWNSAARGARGEQAHNARLTDADVKEIRIRHISGEPIRALARAYGIAQCAIQRVVRRTGWKHVA